MRLKYDIPREEVNRLLVQVGAHQVMLRRQIMNLISETADRIVRDAKQLAPVDEGDLVRSIKKRLYEQSLSIAGDIIATAPHAHLVELGTVRSGATPFITPAFEAHIGQFTAELRRLIR